MKSVITYIVSLCLVVTIAELSSYRDMAWYSQHMSSLNVQDKHSKHEESEIDKAKIEQIRLKKLSQMAHYFGISSEGKSIKQLKHDIEQAKKDNPEKWELFKAELHKRKLERLQHE